MEPLEDADAARFRAVAARSNYLAADRADIMYATKEVCRQMAIPTKGGWKKMKRIGRYLKANARMAMKVPLAGR